MDSELITQHLQLDESSDIELDLLTLQPWEHDQDIQWNEEYFTNCNFTQFVIAYIIDPELTTELSRNSFNEINTEHLDLASQILKNECEIELIEKIRELHPEISKISIFTGNFLSNPIEILYELSLFQNLESLIIIFDDINVPELMETYSHGSRVFPLNFKFPNLKQLEIKHRSFIHSNEIHNINWIIEGITINTRALTEITLMNVNLSSITCYHLMDNNLEKIRFKNVRYELISHHLKNLFMKTTLRSLFICENEKVYKECESIQSLLQAMDNFSFLRKVAITILSDPTLNYGNLGSTNQLKELIIYQPIETTNEIRLNFLKIITSLASHNRNIRLKIIFFHKELPENLNTFDINPILQRLFNEYMRTYIPKIFLNVTIETPESHPFSRYPFYSTNEPIEDSPRPSSPYDPEFPTNSDEE